MLVQKFVLFGCAYYSYTSQISSHENMYNIKQNEIVVHNTALNITNQFKPKCLNGQILGNY